MASLANCPHCGTSLLGGEIPADIRHYYGTATHWRREIVVEVMGAYDGGLYNRCPDCGGEWHRFPVGHPLRATAEKYIGGADAKPR